MVARRRPEIPTTAPAAGFPLRRITLAFVPPAVFAHQGGWDEMLLVAAPLVLFALLLGLANRRAGRQASDEEDDVSRE